MKRKYRFTYHARERFKHRFNKLVQDGNVVLSLLNQIKEATPDNSILNNTRFMTYLYQEYGYRQFDFLVNDQIVFVCYEDDLITVYPRKGSKFDNNTSRFRKN